MATQPPWKPPVELPWGDALSPGFERHFRAPLTDWFRASLSPATLAPVGLKTRVTWNHSGYWPHDVGYFADALFAAGDTRILIALDAALYELAGKDEVATGHTRPPTRGWRFGLAGQ